MWAVFLIFLMITFISWITTLGSIREIQSGTARLDTITELTGIADEKEVARRFGTPDDRERYSIPPGHAEKMMKRGKLMNLADVFCIACFTAALISKHMLIRYLGLGSMFYQISDWLWTMYKIWKYRMPWSSNSPSS